MNITNFCPISGFDQISSLVNAYLEEKDIPNPIRQEIVQLQFENIKFDHIILKYDGLPPDRYLPKLFHEFTEVILGVDERILAENEPKIIRILKKFTGTIGGRNAVVENFRRFQIRDEDARIEIAEICARGTSSLIRRYADFGIRDLRATERIAKACLARTLSFAMDNFSVFRLPGNHPMSQFVVWAKANQIDAIGANIHDQEFADEVEKDSLILLDPAVRHFYDRIPASKAELKYTWAKSLRVQLAKLGSGGVRIDRAALWLRNSKMVYDFSRFRLVHEALFRLEADTILSPAEKERVLDALFDSKLPLKEIVHFLIVENHGKSSLIKTALSQGPLHLTSLTWDIFYEEFSDGMDKAEFEERFSHTFGSTRFPDAIRILAGKVRQYIPMNSSTEFREAVDSALRLVIRSIMNGTFNQIRHQNKHFARLDPELLRQWDEPSKIKFLNGETVEDTAHFIDLLLMASEGARSCLDIQGKAAFNANLLGTLLHGWNRIIAVKDDHGKIISRAMLRLLWRGDKPILYIENAYPENIPKDHMTQILTVAMAKAKRMGLDLASTKGTGAALGPLSARGGAAPSEYVDAMKGSQEGGIYEFLKARLVIEPHLSDVLSSDDEADF